MGTQRLWFLPCCCCRCRSRCRSRCCCPSGLWLRDACRSRRRRVLRVSDITRNDGLGTRGTDHPDKRDVRVLLEEALQRLPAVGVAHTVALGAQRQRVGQPRDLLFNDIARQQVPHTLRHNAQQRNLLVQERVCGLLVWCKRPCPSFCLSLCWGRVFDPWV